ncbi:Tyrosyl-DNA phosphodiesterase 1 [Halotydeus destructor]|nr:Tyrosyl-DNA phosphodiesterase 1 [Halotydeus destructor]
MMTLLQPISDCSTAFNLYFSKVRGIADVYNEFMSVDIAEILSPKFGKLQESAHFNYEIDLDWLMKQYSLEFRKLPLLVVHQNKPHTNERLKAEAQPHPNVKLCPIYIRDAFGTHHSKIMLLRYEEGIRIVISTANLVNSDWRKKTEFVWISPVLPALKNEQSFGDSPTNFKRDFIEYMNTYKAKQLDSWISLIKRHDFSDIKVFLVASVPGRHVGLEKEKYGHLKLRKILSTHGPSAQKVTNNWPCVGQFSSIGSLGANQANWLTSEFLTSLKTTKTEKKSPVKLVSSVPSTPLKLVFPSTEDVRTSIEGYMAGGSLPYSIKTHSKQTWLRTFLHRWISEEKGRTHASPHIKTFFRHSPDHTEVAYMYTGSHNLSKAAWGALEKSGSQLAIRSYEIGVLFLPQQFGSQQVFTVSKGLYVEGDGSEVPYSIPLPVDLPLTPYSAQDVPWCWDVPIRSKPDVNGNIWSPD